MKNIKSYLFILLALVAVTACNTGGFKKTKSGLMFKILSDGKNEVAKKGQFLKISFEQKIRDSVLYNSKDAMPAYAPVDSAIPNYTASEIFPLLRKGDSAVIVQLADSLQRRSGQPLPPFIKKKDKITLSFRVLEIFPNEQALQADRDKEVAVKSNSETKAVEDYIATNKINATKTQKGTFVEVKNEGTGMAVDSGKEISVLYTGKLFPSGKVFESNMTGKDSKPYVFVIGEHSPMGGVIQGWDDGLRLLKKGGKGTLYIPAFLAYGAQPGPGHTQFENLIFDVEILDVKDAPKKDPSLGKNMPNLQLPQVTGKPAPSPKH